MAEAHKYSGGLDGLKEAAQVFPALDWRWNHGGTAYVFDEKKDEYVVVNDGDYIVSIGSRFEVSDTKPEKAKTAEAPKEEPSTEDDETPQDLSGSNVHEDVE